jgi:hypothetical protein
LKSKFSENKKCLDFSLVSPMSYGVFAYFFWLTISDALKGLIAESPTLDDSGIRDCPVKTLEDSFLLKEL